ncbi:rRNA maturation RNase YbeY [Treponema parvum]|uniref:Endoribonuclease YbeY n=1 Tax=Treponema parvum TaxID=138851 RepID=A0A975ICU1_9SPIR|nr:rRNA maturation RNase YbeY [Treponema parvum]QTQ12043.1 rRNA maturation RNase YbeY [Treponema parvum]QTQ15981.1 rRNA maturation RNase YbeY [Treponema parvum]
MANCVFISFQEGIEEPVWADNAKKFILNVMEKLNYDGKALSVLFCGDEMMRRLNGEYRHIDSSTDVLSFEDNSPYTDEDGVEWINAGDIAISLDMLVKNAQYFDCTEDEELKRLLVHALLHLAGMDHGNEHIEKDHKPFCDMLVLQEKLLFELRGEKIITG